MIKTLRLKFIAVSMISIMIVLSIIVAVINISSYHNIQVKADHVLNILLENDAKFPIENRSEYFLDKKVNPEMPYETRYFVVEFNDNNEIILVNTGKVAAIQTEDAVTFATQILSEEKEKGFYKNYRFQKQDHIIIFVDVGRELSAFYSLLQTSAIMSLVGFISVLILVTFFSKVVFKPVSESYEKQKQFITDASHELKTPLAIIQADVEVLELEGEDNQWINSIKNQISRLSTLVHQMVILSKMDETKELHHYDTFDLSFTLREAIEEFIPIITTKQQKLIQNIDDKYIYKGDQTLIKQMFSLLLDNATKYCVEYGTIEITFKKKGKRVEIILKNDVENIEKGNHDILFERFYRLDSSRQSSSGGSGIGLSIVKSIVDIHKGKIHAHSQNEKSIEFHIIL